MIVSGRQILIANTAVIVAGLTVAYFLGKDAGGFIDEAYPYSLMTIGVAFITIFGLLELPGGKGPAEPSSPPVFDLPSPSRCSSCATGYWTLDATDKPSEYATTMIPILE